MKKPRISVLLSCYNGSRWLSQAIESILNQTLGNFEFIIVDDGSTDNSLKIIKEYAQQDSRIVVLAKKNTGLADSLNKGLEIARGDWIARLDVDDISEPSRLQKQLIIAESKKNIVFVGSGLFAIDESGSILQTYHYPISHRLLVRNLCTSRKFPAHSSAFFRTDVVRAIGGYRSRIERSQDWDLWLRLSKYGELVCAAEPLVMLRQHSQQITHDESGKKSRIYNKIALISYYLYRNGFIDPVQENDKVFECFRNFVIHRLDEVQLHEFMDYISNIKAQLARHPHEIMGLLKVVHYIFSKPRFVCRYLRGYMFGDNFANKAAQEWMKYYSQSNF